ncbi:MAG: diguanylate cyclase [Actinomycetales bacterium]|nr:diguanylate cyclase [Actinomycetales bacterium]
MAEHPASPVILATTGVEEFQANLLRGIHPVLDAHGLPRVVYIDQLGTPGLPADFVDFLRGSRPTGLLSTHLWREEHLDELRTLTRELSLPSVIISSDYPDVACVKGDNVTGMRELMDHLLDECGVRRPVLVRGIAFQQDSMEREGVFREEMARRGIPVDEDLVVDGEFWSDIAHRALRTLLQHRRDFDAVVACNDLSARGCIGALTDSGLRVPEDVLVTGFDNDRDTLQWPGLTTVDPDLTEQGRVAAELLVSQIAGDPARPTVVVPSRLVVRDSTSISARSDREQLGTALHMVETARAHLAHRDASANLARTTLASRTLDDVIEALASSLNWLKLRRCFVAVRSDLCGDLRDVPTDLFTEPAPETAAEREGGQVGRQVAGSADGEQSTRQPRSSTPVRLLLDYRDGVTHPPPAEPFPSHQLLPDPLQGQLSEGLLLVFALVLGHREFGYLLMERHPSPLTFNETLHADLARALDAVFKQRVLEAHAASLEDTVARRTRELQAEIMVRQRAERQLQLANDELRQVAMRDGLTGIANRAAFDQHLGHHWQALTRTHHPLTMLMVDVDRFKDYNDHHGHIAGDDTLRIVAECLHDSTYRPEDLAARYGGEEFAAVLPGSDANAGLTVAMRFQAALAERAIPHGASDVAPVVTASVGIAVAHPDGHTEPTALVAAADQALYRAKQCGRNRAILLELDGPAVAPPETTQGPPRPTPGGRPSPHP